MNRRAVLVLSLLMAIGCASDQTLAPAAGGAPERAKVTNPTGAGLLVVAGGGTVGTQGDTTAWSFLLYRTLLQHGDIDGDGIIKVAIVGAAATTSLPVSYVQWMGGVLGLNVAATQYIVPDIASANNEVTTAKVAAADVIFMDGGNEALYYDAWNGTALESAILTASGLGAAIGGTSAGAMAMSQYCFCGNTGLQASQVMADARTIWLDDQSIPGTSAIHTDFLNILAGIYVEPHFTTKGKLGRLMGVLARAVEDNADPSILAIGLDERTGLIISNDTAQVVGIGMATFMHESPTTVRIRDGGRPLVYTDMVSDNLTHGWLYDLALHAPITSTLPVGVTPFVWQGPGTTLNAGALTIQGVIETDKTKFQRVATYYPSNYTLVQTTAPVYVRNGIGFTDAGNTTKRGYKQETLLRALVSWPSHLGVFAFSGDSLVRYRHFRSDLHRRAGDYLQGVVALPIQRGHHRRQPEGGGDDQPAGERAGGVGCPGHALQHQNASDRAVKRPEVNPTKRVALILPATRSAFERGGLRHAAPSSGTTGIIPRAKE